MAPAVNLSSSSSSSVSVNTQVKGKSDWNHAQEVVEELKRETETPVKRLNLIINTMAERMCAGLAMEGVSKDYIMIVNLLMSHLPGTYSLAVQSCCDAPFLMFLLSFLSA